MAFRLISVLIFAFIISIVTGQQKLGPFTLKSGKTAHKLSSDPIIVKDDHTFEIPNLYYDGTGPDTYFMIGTGDPPPEYPKTAPGHKIPNEKGNCEVLKAYNGETITLVLPSKYTVPKMGWLAVYCIKNKHTFGYVVIPKTLNVPAKNPEEKLPMDCSEVSPQLVTTEGRGKISSSGSQPQLQILLMASALIVLTIMKVNIE